MVGVETVDLKLPGYSPVIMSRRGSVQGHGVAMGLLRSRPAMPSERHSLCSCDVPQSGGAISALVATGSITLKGVSPLRFPGGRA